MKSWKVKLVAFVVIVVFAILGFEAWHEHRAAIAYHELATTVSAITSITVYGWTGHNSPDVSANFPVESFSAAALSAEHREFAIWKGHNRVVLVLRDGSQRGARFCSHASSFTLDGVPGYFSITGEIGSQFYNSFKHFREEQLYPKQNSVTNAPKM